MKKNTLFIFLSYIIILTTIFLSVVFADTAVLNQLKQSPVPLTISIISIISILSYLLFIIFSHDYKKRNKYAQKEKEIAGLKANEKYRKEFLGNVSHELKTPLFNIQGYVSTLLEEDIEDKRILTKFLNRADKNISRLISVVNDLETISQLESGKLKMEKSEFNLTELIAEALDMHESEALKKLTHLEFPQKGEEIFVKADRNRILTVLSNLISNAIHYGKKGGIAKIFIKQEQHEVWVYVFDDGIGIPKKDKARVFERFYRVDKSRSKESGGTGLGLSIVKHIIDNHNRKIKLSSEKGEGSKFYFSLESVDNQ
ncbi:MAG: ATP-binding protein [Bacteroidota bacterium]|nr:ATP-binding protein [Bacteroidota bacterium]